MGIKSEYSLEENDVMNRSYPIPLGMKGTCYEMREGAKTRFFEIFYVKYDPDNVDRLKNMGTLKYSKLAEYLEHIDPQMIHDSTYFLYRVETFYADPIAADSWEFNQSITDYEQYYFSLFDDIVKFCSDKWGIDPMDFVSRKNTRMQS